MPNSWSHRWYLWSNPKDLRYQISQICQSEIKTALQEFVYYLQLWSLSACIFQGPFFIFLYFESLAQIKECYKRGFWYQLRFWGPKKLKGALRNENKCFFSKRIILQFTRTCFNCFQTLSSLSFWTKRSSFAQKMHNGEVKSEI